MAPYVEIVHPLIDTSGEFPADFGPLRSASQLWGQGTYAPRSADRYSPSVIWTVDRNVIPLDDARSARSGVFWEAGVTVLGVIDSPPGQDAWAGAPALSAGQRSWAVWLGD